MFKDAIVDITLAGATDYMVRDQEVDVLDDTSYLVCVQKDSVAEGLICNQEEGEGLDCNTKDGDGSEDDSDLNVNFEDSDEDVIEISEEVVVDNKDVKGKGKDKGKGK